MLNSVDNNIVIMGGVKNQPPKEQLESDSLNSKLPIAFVDVRFLCEKIMESVSLWVMVKKDDIQFVNKDLNIFSVEMVGRKKDDENKSIIFRERNHNKLI